MVFYVDEAFNPLNRNYIFETLLRLGKSIHSEFTKTHAYIMARHVGLQCSNYDASFFNDLPDDKEDFLDETSDSIKFYGGEVDWNTFNDTNSEHKKYYDDAISTLKEIANKQFEKSNIKNAGTIEFEYYNFEFTCIFYAK